MTFSTRTLHPVYAALVGAATALAGTPAFSHGDKHEHGVVHLDIAVDGNELVVQLESPLDSVLGFEHLPRTEAERKAVAAMLDKLRQGASLFQPETAAGCQFREAALESALIEPTPASASGASSGTATAPVIEAAAKATKDSASAHQHLDMDATYHFACATPQKLGAITQALFSTFPRVQRIDVQTASAKGQGKQTLRRPDTTIKLAP